MENLQPLDVLKKKVAEIPLPKFEIYQFEKARPYFENLVKQLIPYIRRHEYNLIIGDDVSNRLPTLVLGGLLKEIYQEDKVRPPQILFFAAGITGGDIVKKRKKN